MPMTDLRIVSDDGRLAEIIRLFDSGPDLISVRDIGWLIDIAREVERKNESLIAAGRQLAATEEYWQAEVERLKRYETDFKNLTIQHCGPKCACVREQREALADAEAEVERLNLLFREADRGCAALLEQREAEVERLRARIIMLLRCHYDEHEHHGSPTCFDIQSPTDEWETAALFHVSMDRSIELSAVPL